MILYEFIITLIFDIIVLNAIYSYNDFTYDFENSIAYEIEQILNGKLIYSFIPKKYCDKNEEILKLGKWKGLKAGCMCPVKGLVSRKCFSKEKTKFLCKDIPEVSYQYYENFDSKKISVKRTKETYGDFLFK